MPGRFNANPDEDVDTESDQDALPLNLDQSPGVVVITSKFDRWQTSEGMPVADRLDVLALDADGSLLVVELKRGTAPHTVHMQAINYAAMVSRLTPASCTDRGGRAR